MPLPDSMHLNSPSFLVESTMIVSKNSMCLLMRPLLECVKQQFSVEGQSLKWGGYFVHCSRTDGL